MNDDTTTTAPAAETWDEKNRRIAREKHAAKLAAFTQRITAFYDALETALKAAGATAVERKLGKEWITGTEINQITAVDGETVGISFTEQRTNFSRRGNGILRLTYQVFGGQDTTKSHRPEGKAGFKIHEIAKDIVRWIDQVKRDRAHRQSMESNRAVSINHVKALRAEFGWLEYDGRLEASSGDPSKVYLKLNLCGTTDQIRAAVAGLKAAGFPLK